MTTKSYFTEEECARVSPAPLVPGLAIPPADPGGSIEAAEESMAMMKSATNPASREQLLAEVALEIQALAQQRHHLLSGLKPTSQQHLGEQVLDELRSVQELVSAKVTPEESAAHAGWLVHCSG